MTTKVRRRIPFYEDTTRLAGRTVRVHRNLHRSCWSITEDGKVIAREALFLGCGNLLVTI